MPAATLPDQIVLRRPGPGSGVTLYGVISLSHLPQTSVGSAISPALVVAQDDRRSFGSGQEFVAPAHQHRCSEQLTTSLGEPVLIAVGITGVGDAFEQAGVDQRAEPCG